MVRYAHHELGGGLAWLSGCVIGGAVAVVVRGGMPVGGDTVAQSAALVIGCFMILTFVHASGLRLVSVKRRFRTAVPLPSDVQVSRSTPWDGGLVILFLCPAVLTYFWLENSLFVILLPTDSLARATTAAWWERRHGRLLWRGAFKNSGQLAYTPISPRFRP